MRTTVDIEGDVLEAARALAASEGRSLGQVLSRLARRGLTHNLRVVESDFPTFTVPEDAPVITEEIVRRVLDEV